MTTLLAVLLTVTLQAPFGEAEVQVLGAPSARTIDVTVEVEGEPVAVLARITTLTGELDPVALVSRGGGRYGQAIRLTEWEDAAIAFEYIGADGTTTISAASTLTELGVDPELVRPSVSVAPPESEGLPIDPWLLAAGAAALAAVVLLGFWASGSLGDFGKSEDWTYTGSAAEDDARDEAAAEESAPID